MKSKSIHSLTVIIAILLVFFGFYQAKAQKQSAKFEAFTKITLTINAIGNSEYRKDTINTALSDKYCGDGTPIYSELQEEGITAQVLSALDANGHCVRTDLAIMPNLTAMNAFLSRVGGYLKKSGNKITLLMRHKFGGLKNNYDYVGQAQVIVKMPSITSYSPKAGVKSKTGDAQQIIWESDIHADFSGDMEVSGELSKECYIPITVEQLKCIFPSLNSTVAENLVNSLNGAMEAAGANTPARQAAFIAQSAKETANFTKLTESGRESYFDKYEPGTSAGTALGNTEVGDGATYKGRGWFHLTGRDNYTRASKYINKQGLNVDLVGNPELVETDSAVNNAVSAWFWKTRKINAKADDINKITKIINGGQNGAEERIANYNKAKTCLPTTNKCSPQTK